MHKLRYTVGLGVISALACSTGADAPTGDAREPVGIVRQSQLVCSGQTCPTNSACCSGSCTNVKVDTNNCGGCGVVCTGVGPTCNDGHCCRRGRVWCSSRAQCQFPNPCDCPPVIDTWLLQHPTVANAMKWQFTNTDGNAYEPVPADVVAYPAWSATMKLELREQFEARFTAYCKGLSFTESLPDPPSNIAPYVGEDDAKPYVHVSSQSAESIYLASVASSLAVELAGVVPWSILSYDAEDLFVLFDSAALMSRRGDDQSFLLGDWFSAYRAAHRKSNRSAVVPPPPYEALRFLRGESPTWPTRILASTRYATIVNLLQFARAKMVHSKGPLTYEVCDQTWQYRGLSPVTRVISGTTSTYPSTTPPFDPFQHWTAGCKGTSGFFRDVLRTVNIPVEIPISCDHKQLYFRTEGLYLDHADNPYSGYDLATFPPEAALIDQSRYEDWFGTNEHNEAAAVTSGPACDNIGRRVLELMGTWP